MLVLPEICTQNGEFTAANTSDLAPPNFRDMNINVSIYELQKRICH